MQTGMTNDDRYKACGVHEFGGERMVVVSDDHTGFINLLVCERLLKATSIRGSHAVATT